MSESPKTMLLCLRCHDPRCQKEHAGHPGICEVCGEQKLVAICDRKRSADE